MADELKNRVAIVTGSGQGIGRWSDSEIIKTIKHKEGFWTFEELTEKVPKLIQTDIE